MIRTHGPVRSLRLRRAARRTARRRRNLFAEPLEARLLLSISTGPSSDGAAAAGAYAVVSQNAAGGGADAPGPEVTKVLVGSTSWSAAFRNQLVAGGLGTADGYAVPSGAGQLAPLPWSGLNQIVVQFSKNVDVTQDDLALEGVAVPVYAYSNFSYNAGTFTATWTLVTPINKDSVVLRLDGHSATGVRDTPGHLLDGEWTDGADAFPSGDGAAGGDLDFRVRALPGDFNQDGSVNISDIQQVATSWLQGVPLRDGSGDGIVDISEVQLVAQHWLETAPSDVQPPSAPAGLTAVPTSASQINLSWPAATDNVAVTGYKIERQDPGVPGFAEIGTATGTTFVDTPLTSGATYTYRVRATDGVGNLGPYSPVATATTLRAGLMAAYAFGEGAGTTVADMSGYGNTGTLSGAVWTSSGRYGNALSFDGSSALVNVADSTSLNLTAGLTLEAWVNPATASSAWRDIIYKAGDVYYLEGSSPQQAPGLGGTFSPTLLAGVGALTPNAWSYLTATYDGATMRLYVNGAEVASRAQTGPIQTSNGALSIGGDSLFGQYFFGLIDEVRVYNRALSVAEIQGDMDTAVSPLPDATPPTVAMTAPTNGADVSGFTAVSATATDNVGIVGVQFLLDGVALGAEDTTAPYTLSWDTTTVANGSHTLSARARDGSSHVTVSAAIAVNVTNVTDPAVIGRWSSVMDWPLVAINMVLLKNGKILMWNGQECIGGASAQVWAPATNTFTDVTLTNPDGSNRDIFCSGQTALADGRVLVAGGHECAVPGFLGSNNSTIFDPVTNAWTLEPDMEYRRWYPSITTMPDGRAIIIGGGGVDFTPASYSNNPEVFDPQTSTWTTLEDAELTVPNYSFIFVLPDGHMLVAGSDEAQMATYELDVASQTWSVVDPSILDAGSAVMYLPGKVMKTGASYIAGNLGNMEGVPSSANTYVLDVTQPSPAWQQTASMAYPRTDLNLTVLPDGNVLSTGGSTDISGEFPQYAVLPAEMWSPATQNWTTMASMATPRMYHSTALLLPDGRVLSAGGGRTGDFVSYDYPSAEIYSPPYLFQGARPTITSAPAQVAYNASFFVQTPDAASIASVSLVRNGSVTHAVNMDQRFVPLSFTPGSGGLNVQAPADANLAPPGEYMLFIVNSDGVPSVAPFVRLPAPYEDTQPPTAPANLSATGSIGTASLSWTAATDDTGVVRYDVYRSTTPGFTPSLANRVAQPTTTSYQDTGLAAGTYYYRVAAEDAAGNIGAFSAQATATVAADTVAPSVMITGPTGGNVSGTIAVNANASDDQAVAGVQFLLDGNNLGAEDTVAPYSVAWSTTLVTNGSHVLSARARDTGGNTTTSAPVAVTVSNAASAGLVLALGFDEGAGTTTADISGFANNGTLAGASWTAAGKFGNALLFNGTSALVTVNDASSLDLTTGMTLEAWVKPGSLSSVWRDVIYKSNDIYYLEGSSNQSQKPALGGTFSPSPIYGPAALAANTWSHLAGTYDGATMRLYVNGTQVSSRSQTSAIQTSSGALTIGGDALFGQYFAGLIDEVRVYNRALSAAEIQADMNKPVGSPLVLMGEATASSDAASPLSAAEAAPLFDEAVSRWRAALGDTQATRKLSDVRVDVMDLPAATLGLAAATIIFIDKDAAGHGWFLDPTPWEDSEFARGLASSPAKYKADLLSVLVHELGHILGMGDDRMADPFATSSVMADALPLGVRRSPLGGTASTPRVNAPSVTATLADPATATSQQARESVVDALWAEFDRLGELGRGPIRRARFGFVD